MNFEVIDGLDVFNRVPNWRLHMAHLSLAPDYSEQVLDVAIKGAKTRVRKRFEKTPWEDEPTLCALREALGPDQQCTSECLAREILDGGEFPRAAHPGVEFRDLLALRTMLPWSVMEARQVLFPMQYRLGEAGETGEQRGQEVDLEGLPVLADGRGVVASPCCSHDAARLTDDAQEVVLVAYTPMSIAQEFTARTELGRLMWMTWVFRFESEKAFKPPR